VVVVDGAVELAPSDVADSLASRSPPRHAGRTRSDTTVAARTTLVLPDIPPECPPAAALPQARSDLHWLSLAFLRLGLGLRPRAEQRRRVGACAGAGKLRRLSGGTCATRWPSGIRNSQPPFRNRSGFGAASPPARRRALKGTEDRRDARRQDATLCRQVRPEPSRQRRRSSLLGK
jgi:hypothetical protein